MKLVFALVLLFGGAILYMLHGEPQYDDTLIAHFPVDSKADMTRNVTDDPHTIDRAVSSDGNGSLRIDATGEQIVNLYRIWGEEEDLSFRRLVYAADVRTEDVRGDVFLVMQAGVTSVPGGSMAVVGNAGAIRGTNDWATLEAAAGNPGGSRLLETTLQLHIGGPGTVWIDNVKLIKRQTL
jgi:hypothetical protein